VTVVGIFATWEEFYGIYCWILYIKDNKLPPAWRRVRRHLQRVAKPFAKLGEIVWRWVKIKGISVWRWAVGLSAQQFMSVCAWLRRSWLWNTILVGGLDLMVFAMLGRI